MANRFSWSAPCHYKAITENRQKRGEIISASLLFNTSQVALSVPLQWDGGKNWKSKSWRICGCDKDCLTGETKAAHTRKAKQSSHSPLPMGRQGSCHFQESRALSHVTVFWEMSPLERFPLSSFFPQLYMLSMMHCDMEHPSVQAVSPLKLLVHPLASGGGGEG